MSLMRVEIVCEMSNLEGGKGKIQGVFGGLRGWARHSMQADASRPFAVSELYLGPVCEGLLSNNIVWQHVIGYAMQACMIVTTDTVAPAHTCRRLPLCAHTVAPSCVQRTHGGCSSSFQVPLHVFDTQAAGHALVGSGYMHNLDSGCL
jgi:hypothetical protein